MVHCYCEFAEDTVTEVTDESLAAVQRTATLEKPTGNIGKGNEEHENQAQVLLPFLEGKSVALAESQEIDENDVSAFQYHAASKNGRTTSKDCSQYMNEVQRDSAKMNGGSAAVMAGDSALGVAGAIAESMMDGKTAGLILGAVSGPVGGFLVGVAAEFFIEDPNNQRIMNLQNGLMCVHEKLQELEVELERTKEKVAENTKWISLLSQLPLKKKLGRMKLLAMDHRKCVRLLTCVASSDALSICERDIEQRIHRCNSKAFLDHLTAGNDYYFMRNPEINSWNQQIPLAFAQQEHWTYARNFLGQYLLLFSAMGFIWNSLELWAMALCTRSNLMFFTQYCQDSDVENIKWGLKAFKESVQIQLQDERVIAQKIKEAEENNTLPLHTSKNIKWKPMNCTYMAVDLIPFAGIDGTRLHADARFHMLGCAEVSADSCDDEPCYIDQSRSTIMKSAGCYRKQWLHLDALKAFGKVYTCSSGHVYYDCWVPGAGVLASGRNFRGNEFIDWGDICPNGAASTWMYKEHYNEMNKELDTLAEMGKFLSELQFREPPYLLAKGRWALSGSYAGKKTTKVLADDLWARNQSWACLSERREQDPYKEKEMGTTCCSDQDDEGQRNPHCTRGAWADANQTCANMGRRLCTVQELAGGKGEASGCGFDGHLVWSSDPCPVIEGDDRLFHLPLHS